MTYMYGGTILRVNLDNAEITKEPTEAHGGDFLGGRGINIDLVLYCVPWQVLILELLHPFQTERMEPGLQILMLR